MYDDMCWDLKCGIWRDCSLAVSRLVQGVLRCARWCARCKVRCALCKVVYVEMCKVAERNRRYDPDVPGLGGCISWHLLGFVPSEMVLVGTGWRITGDQAGIFVMQNPTGHSYWEMYCLRTWLWYLHAHFSNQSCSAQETEFFVTRCLFESLSKGNLVNMCKDENSTLKNDHWCIPDICHF